MNVFTLKMRVFLLFWSVIMLALSIGATYAGVSSFLEYLLFPELVVYSTGMIALVFSFVIILPLCLAGFYSSVKGQRLSESKGLCLFRLFIGGVVVSIAVAFSFKFYYLYELKDRGYVACQGIPAGWMPGMAKQYVTNSSLCYKNG